MSELKLIVTALLAGLPEGDQRNRLKKLIKAMLDFPTYVAGLSPTADAVNDKDVILDGLFAKRESLNAEQKSNTEDIITLMTEMCDDVTYHWGPQTQIAPGITVAKIKELGFGIKGEDNLESESAVSVTNSKPIFSDVDLNRHLEHTLTLRCSMTGKIGIPDDAKRVDIYILMGNTAPIDLSNMHYLGSCVRGKFTSHFAATELGQTVWYIAVYVPKKAGTSVELSDVQKSEVV